MAGKIVGITLELRGDSDDLTKSLKEVDKSLGTTKSALNDINKALKLDPKNVELLAQKQGLLTKQIDQTKEKLNIMKQVAADAAEGLKKGTVTQEQYAKLTAELAKTELSLKAMQNEAEATAHAMQDMASDADTLQNRMDELDGNLKKTETALKSIDAALKLDPGNTELVAQKQQLLAHQIELTQEKLELMKQSAEGAAEGLEKGTVTKEEYAQLTAKISMTESELKGLEQAAAGSADALEATGEAADGTVDGLSDTSKESGAAKTAMGALDKATGGLASSLAALAANPITAVIAALGILVTAVKKSVDELKKIAETIKNLVVAAVEKFADILEGVTEQIDKTIRKLAEFTKEGASYADEVKTMAAETGLAAEEIQRLMYISELIDVPVSTMTSSMTKLEKAMASASKGSGDAAKAFEKLNVRFKNDDGTYRKAADVFNDLVTSLGSVEDEVERDTLAMTLFGKSAKDLNPLIKASKEDLEKFNKAAQESGYILSDEVLDAYGDFDDSLQMLDKACEAAQHGLGLVLLPVLSQMASEGVPLLNELASGIVNANGDIEEIGKVIDSVLPKALDSFVKNLPQMVEVVKKLINTFLTSLNNNLPAILDAGIEILKALVDGLLNPESVKAIMDGVTQVVESLVEFLKDHGAEIIDLGVFILTTIINGIAEALPELIPAIAEAIGVIVDELTKPETLDVIIEAAITLFESLCDGLERALPTIVEKLPEAIDRICKKLIETQMIEKIINAGIKLFEALLDSGVIDEVVRVLGENAGPIVRLLTRIGVKMYELRDALFKETVKIFYELGETMIDEMVSGMLAKIPLIGPYLATIRQTIRSLIMGDDGGSSTPQYPHFDNNTQNPGMSQGQADLINAGEGQFYHPPQNGGGSVGTMSLDAMSVYAQRDYSYTAERIVNALENTDTTQVTNVFIGDEKIDTVISKSQGRANYVNGGRY